MAIKFSLSLWLAVLAIVTQIHGATVPQILLDVGNNPDTNTAPLLADLRSGLSPDTLGPNGWTALHIAAGLNKPNMAKILRDNQANLDIQDANSYTALHHATGQDHVDVMNKLVPGGSNTEIQGPNQWRALHLAAGNGYADAISILINHADPNAIDVNGDTPLHIAVGRNYLAAANILLTKPQT
jgi:ankyrin repeat protein